MNFPSKLALEQYRSIDPWLSPVSYHGTRPSPTERQNERDRGDLPVQKKRHIHTQREREMDRKKEKERERERLSRSAYVNEYTLESIEYTFNTHLTHRIHGILFSPTVLAKSLLKQFVVNVSISTFSKGDAFASIPHGASHHVHPLHLRLSYRCGWPRHVTNCSWVSILPISGCTGFWERSQGARNIDILTAPDGTLLRGHVNLALRRGSRKIYQPYTVLLECMWLKGADWRQVGT